MLHLAQNCLMSLQNSSRCTKLDIFWIALQDRQNRRSLGVISTPRGGTFTGPVLNALDWSGLLWLRRDIDRGIDLDCHPECVDLPGLECCDHGCDIAAPDDSDPW